MRDIDLLVVGDCNPDVVLSGPDLHPRFGQSESWVERAQLVVGGTSSITACGAARLGLRTAMAAVVGDDVLGRFMQDALARRGVDTSPMVTHPRVPTGLSTVLVEPGDRATLTYPGTMRTLTVEMVSEELLRRCRHVHTGGWYLQGSPDALATILERARSAGATTSLDPGADPDGGWDGGLPAFLPKLDLLMPNEAEARALAGVDDVAQAAAALASAGPGVVVKCGADGVLAAAGGEVVRAPALRCDVVDTIGAGDSTNAGWLAAWLRGWPVARAARVAAVCGSLSTRAGGGIAGQPTWGEAVALL